jgi:ATP citrate (pro-S)-lyase
MSAKAIREAKGKQLLGKYLSSVIAPVQLASYYASVSWDSLVSTNPWLLTQKLVVKPDQLIKRRGKLGLIKVNVDLNEAKKYINEHIDQEIMIGRASGKLTNFIIEPFIPHTQQEEYYICIYSNRDGETILFHHEGGVDVGDVDSKALKINLPIDGQLNVNDLASKLLIHVANQKKKEMLTLFITNLFETYMELHFTYLEINPLVVTENQIFILDLASKIDQTADYLCKTKWGGEIEFPPPFGRDAYPEEAYIADLDSKSGASLKLTILNPKGRIWTMVAGGGASVIYSDTICDLGGASELANYGEYSGAPSEQQTYEYAKTILSLMLKEKHECGKVLIIGGGIANFTNVAATFKGIVKVLQEYNLKIIEHNISIYVRRAGPNYQEGLRLMKEVGQSLNIPIHVFGPETHMTAIVGMALGKRDIPCPAEPLVTTANFLLPTNDYNETVESTNTKTRSGSISHQDSVSKQRELSDYVSISKEDVRPLFTDKTKSIVWGMQNKAVQGMLDFDHVCSRKEPSVVAMIYPFTGDHKQKFYWGHREILIPIYKNMSDAMKKHPEADVLINFASLRSAYESTMETLTYPQIRCIAIIAEGIPEQLTRRMNKLAQQKNVVIIGPATVGGLKPGCFKIGNTGGMLDNILMSKLYRPGSVAYVSRSGGMSNELNNIVSRNSNGVYEGIAIGGDRYPGTTFIDHILRYEDDPEAKIIVLLGEVGGTEEYKIIDAIKSKRITKPLIAWCIGTCASMFTSEVQFGHAGSCANSDMEQATTKNNNFREAGAYVPHSFDDLGDVIKKVYEQLVEIKVILPKPEQAPPSVPMDYDWARELGLIRKPASFMSSICDDRGQELLYAGMPITDVIKEDMGIGGVLSLLWFRKRLPRHACRYLEMCLMVTADHGPAVSGAHNTIVCARAGKDLVSCLTSGLLTIGERFGGALDGAAKQFSEAYDAGLTPMEFVNKMRKDGKLIMGVGHRVKSLNNPDMRVILLKQFAKEHFPVTPLLDYALEVEKITTSKKPNLILNVDGIIGVSMVDLFRNSGCFTMEEANEFVECGALNGIFVLGRSMGFIGHFLDQKRLKQGLYRHPWDDISYVMPEQI